MLAFDINRDADIVHGLAGIPLVRLHQDAFGITGRLDPHVVIEDSLGAVRITSYNVCYTKLLRLQNPK